MEGEYFYGAVLEGEGATTTWISGEGGQEEHSPLFKLVIKQFLLGHKAKEDEYNVVEVETMSANSAVKIPISVLKVGEKRSSIVNIEFPEAPVTFRLVQGSGPLYIHGNIVSTYMEQVEETEDECLELVEEEEDDERGDNRKRKLDENGAKSANGGSNSQKTGKKQKTG